MERIETDLTCVGAGFTGTTFISLHGAYLQSLRAQGHDFTPERCLLVDKNSFGPGLPYAHGSDFFLLNQPASAMSHDPSDPERFTRWLDQRFPNQYSSTSFASRELYGEYLKDLTREIQYAAKQVGNPYTLETKLATIREIDHNGSDFVLRYDHGEICTKTLVLADGHQKSRLLDAFEGAAGYFESPYDVGRVRSTLAQSNEHSAVGVIGTGQTFVDTLAALDHVGYRGQVYALSRHGALPWRYEPQADGGTAQSRAYQLQFLNVSSFDDKQNAIHSFNAELARGQQEGFDTGQITYAVLQSLRDVPETLTDVQRSAWKAVQELALTHYSNPTPPERFELIQAFRESGRLHVLKGAADENTLRQEGTKIVFDLPERGEVRCSAVFNGASYARSIYNRRQEVASPLLRQAAAKGWLRIEHASTVTGAQNIPGLYVLGPACHGDKWGVETFRKGNDTVAHVIADNYVQNHESRDKPINELRF